MEDTEMSKWRPNNLCGCGSGQYREALYDARGIFCCYYCSACETIKRSKYRADIFTDQNYWHDEPIDEDQ